MNLDELDLKRKEFADFFKDIDWFEIKRQVKEIDSKKESEKFLKDKEKEITKKLKSLEGKYIHVAQYENGGNWNYHIEYFGLEDNEFNIIGERYQAYGPGYDKNNTKTSYFSFEEEADIRIEFNEFIESGFFITQKDYREELVHNIKGLQYLIDLNK